MLAQGIWVRSATNDAASCCAEETSTSAPALAARNSSILGRSAGRMTSFIRMRSEASGVARETSDSARVHQRRLGVARQRRHGEPQRVHWLLEVALDGERDLVATRAQPQANRQKRIEVAAGAKCRQQNPSHRATPFA